MVQVSGTGSPLVLVHGFTTTAEFWREQVEIFSAQYRLIRINLPGHGTSPGPSTRSYTIDAFAGDVVKVFEALRIGSAFLVGLSMGGTIAQKIALDFPELVRALVLVGATPHGLGADVKVDNVLANIDGMGVVAASQRVIERSFGAHAAEELLAFARREVAQTPDFVAREAIASLNASDSRPSLQNIRMPTLVMVGAEDVITPVEESRALVAGIPNSRLEIIAGAGHFPMLEQPESFNRALARFLERQSALSPVPANSA